MPQDTTIVTCDAVLLDPGGELNYPNNLKNYIVRLVPSQPGAYIQLSFEEFEIEPTNDGLSVYDGNYSSIDELDKLALLGEFSGLEEQKPNDIIATNIDGALTLVFNSDDLLNGTGFKINITCKTSEEMVDGNLGTFCNGGILNPGGFSGYLPNQDITTTISAENGRQLVLSFINEFDLAKGDTLFIYNGETTESPLIASYGTNNKLPAGVISGNAARALTLRFVSDNSEEGKGFQTLVTCISNRTLDMRDGMNLRTCGLLFRDPGGGRNYPDLKGKEIVSTFLPNNPGDKLEVNFNSLSLEEDFDFLKVYDGIDINTAPLVAELTGNNTGRPIVANNPEGALTFVFFADEIFNDAGWEAIISCISPEIMRDTTIVGCGTFFTDPGGASNYLSNQDISFTLQSPSRRDQIRVDFSNFDLASGDTLLVYNGITTNTQNLIGSFFGNNLPPSLFSSGIQRALTLRLKTDASETGTGWEARTTCVQSGSITMGNNEVFSICGTFFEDQGGNQDYADNLNQVTTLVPKEIGDKVRIRFLQFDTEEDVDILHIYNGSSINSPLIGAFSGEINEVFDVYATNPEGTLTLQFTSDFDENESGWRSIIDCISPSKLAPDKLEICDAFFTDSGGATENYSNNSDIVTTLVPSNPLQKHKVTFNFFELADDDRLEVYQGTEVVADKLIGVFTGNELPPVLLGDTDSGALTFHFISNGSITAAGWDAQVECIQKNTFPMTNATFSGCEFRFSDSAGNGNYTNNESLINTFISNEPGKQLRVFFNQFNTESGVDILKVYNGTSNNPENLIAELSGVETPLPITANNAQGALTFEFISNENVTTNGWDATLSCVEPTIMSSVVTTGCDIFFLDPSGENDYQPNQNITQTFTAEEGQVIASFESIQLGEGDQIQIFDGVSVSAPLIATITELDFYFFASSTVGSLTFRFISDSNIEGAGWEAKISCWKEFRECGEIFTDPGGNGNYPLGVENEIFTVFYPQNEGERVRAIFNELDLAEGAYLEVYSGDDEETAILLAELEKGSAIPNDLTSTDESGALAFVFYTDFATESASGWEAAIQCFQPLRINNFSQETCSSILLDAGGDRRYGNNENFIATIFPQQRNGGLNNAVSSINFNFFDLGLGDTLFIYDGDRPLPQLLIGAFTGNKVPPFIYAENAKGALTYRFTSDDRNVGEGWEAEISCYSGFFEMTTSIVETCNIRFQDAGGISEYSNSLNDTVTFFPEQIGAKLNIIFGEFELEENFDFLYVFDDSFANPDNLVATLTGDDTPEPITATNLEGALTFVFISDDIVTDDGFIAEINCVPPLIMNNGVETTCTSIFYDPGGFDLPYPAQQNFITTLQPFFNSSKIGVEFTELDLAEGDTLFIYDGNSVNEDNLITSLAGNNIPGFIFGTGAPSALTFHLVSTAEQAGEGWAAQIACFDGVFPMNDNRLVGCGLNFQDPGGNDNYEDDELLTTTFLPVTPGDKVSVNFQSFSLEEDFDSLYVYDGSTIDSTTLITSLSGTEIPPVITATNSIGALTFQFISDESINLEGWSADISCIDSEAMVANTVISDCQKIFLDPAGVKNYPDNYRGSTTIRATTQNASLKVTFNQIDIAEGDTLFIYNGDSRLEKNLIGSYSGTQKPLSILSDNTSSLTFYFVSDESGNAAGWDAFIECIATSQFQNITPSFLDNITNGDFDWGDYDNDGDLDLVVIGIDNSLTTDTPIARLYRNDGGGVFTDIDAFLLDGVSDGSVAWEDYNLDGLLDITIIGTNQFNLASSIIYRNELFKNDGAFVDIGANLIGLTQGSIEWGDYDLDGDPDLIIAGTNNEFSTRLILYENREGVFEEITTNITDFEALNINLADYDKDGDLDILSSAFIYKNLIIEDSIELFSKSQIRSVFDGDVGFSQWGDFDQDGDLDIFLSFYQNNDITVSNVIYENRKNDDFSNILFTLNEGVSEDEGGIPALIDFDGNGNLDIAYSSFLMPIFWRLSASGGALPYTRSNAFLEGFSELKWADIDGDNDPDLTVKPFSDSYALEDDDLDDFDSFGDFSDIDETSLQLYENQLADSENNQSPEPPTNLAVEFTNNDIFLTWDAASDIETPSQLLSYNLYLIDEQRTKFFVSPNSDPVTGRRYKFDQGNVGNRRFYRIRGLAEGNYVFAVQAIDAAQNASQFSEELSFNVTNFQEEASGVLDGVPALYQKIAWGDYDSDGDLDLLLSGVQEFLDDDETEIPVFKIFENDNDELFDITTSIDSPPIANGSTQWVDYNNDGLLDIFLTGDNNLQNVESRLYKQVANKEFVLVDAGIIGMTQGASAWGDYDNDGDVDLFITGQNPDFNIFSQLYKNNGNDQFEPVDIKLDALVNGDAEWEDFDGDGDIDLLIMGAEDEGLILNLRTILYENLGNDQFNVIQTPLPNVFYGDIDWADFDNDGDPDILINGTLNKNFTSRVTKVFENISGEVFQELSTANLREISGISIWGDYDNDRDSDILLYEPLTEVTTLYRNQDGTFIENSLESTKRLGNGSIAWTDFTRDNRLDIFLAGNSDVTIDGRNISQNEIALFTSTLVKADILPEPPTVLLSDTLGTRVDLTWEPSETEGVSYNLALVRNQVESIINPLVSSNGLRQVLKKGNTGFRNSLRVNNLRDGEYQWSVQSISPSYTGGVFSASESFTICNEFYNRGAGIIESNVDENRIGPNGLVEFEANGFDVDIEKWEWDFGDDTPIVEGEVVSHTYDTPGIYTVTLTITNAIECVRVGAQKEIQVVDEIPIQIPVAITPNGDGLNDVLNIRSIESYPDNNLTILNMWGQVVFETSEYQNTWDGTDTSGNLLPAGNYIAILKLNNIDAKPFKTTFTILR